ncbi:MAG TPA: hypothetical protein VME01_08330 [Solirubrobacteraceae bacterium]|nr:hypothetical protein [Solirubrobacteraceae bacterium]
MSEPNEGDTQPTDVLAAEEFVLPAPDPALHHENLELPGDPVSEEPHDVLAAEEFPLPDPSEAHHSLADAERDKTVTLGPRFTIAAALALVLSFKLWRRSRRRRR